MPGSEHVRVRYAPSPTGKQHIGGARTALFNWAFARHTGGTFLLRIEDTDRERSTREHEDAILEGLRWLGVDWGEGPDIGGPHGPYRQTERIARYGSAAASLLAAGQAYRCFCTSERLEELREGQSARGEKPAYDGLCRDLSADVCERRLAAGERAVLRFRVPEGETRFADMVRGEVCFQNREVDDWVMLRPDGLPTYNFAVVCDDVDMRITHVLRGEEHLTNTPKQLLLYRAFGAQPPAFAHLPLMLGQDGKKLSKRTGDTALQDYRDKGYPRDAIVNFLCLQGWALDGKTEIFSVDELVQHFDPGQVSKSGAVFDPEKFLWMAGEYLRREPTEVLAAHCAPHVLASGLMDAEELERRRPWYLELVALERERIRIYSELPARIRHFFAPDDALPWEEKAEQNARKQPGAADTLASYLDWLRPRLAPSFDRAAVRDATKAWVAERKLKMPALFQPMRCALSGEAGGPDMFEVMALLGPERTVRRLERGIERLRAA